MTRTERRMMHIAKSLTFNGELPINNKWQTQFDTDLRHMVKDGLFIMRRWGVGQSKNKKFRGKKQSYLKLTQKGLTWYQTRYKVPK